MKKLFIIILLTFISCAKNTQKNNDATIKAQEIVDAVVKSEDNITGSDSHNKLSEIWKILPLKKQPVIDTTNFDNIKNKREYNSEQIKSLQISAIYPKFYEEEYDFKIKPAYKINLSKKFHTVVINVFKGEHELETILINYNSSNENLIDFKTITYDEIAESMSRKHSKINNNIITIIDEFYGDNKQIDTTKFHINRNGEINQIKTKFSSPLRPNKSIILNKIYTDTIEFRKYHDGGDYPNIEGRKGEVTVGLNYNLNWHDNEKYNFKYGDLIKVKWKMDSIFHAGDGETLDFSERVIDAEKVTSENRSVKFLWRANKFDKELNQEVNSIFINESFCSSITDQEKAALGYISYNIGSECWWDEKRNKEGTNLKCKIVTALDLGYQCSDKQLNFLRNWFSKDTVALKKLESCTTMPYTATVQSTFDEIRLFTDKEKQTITVTYKVNGVNMRLSESWSWTKTDTFEYNSENITLIHSEKTYNSEKKHSSAPIAESKNSFVISCGSGCAMTYSEDNIIKNDDSNEVTFKVKMYVDEVLKNEYNETYVFICATSKINERIKLKDTKNFEIGLLHPDLQENLRSYATQFCMSKK